jgi:hypothetical protein
VRGWGRGQSITVTVIDLRDVEPLVEALKEAVGMVEEWGAYASGYFQEKWDLQGNLRQLRAALKAFEEQPAGVGADQLGRPSREARGVRDNPPVSADSDGNLDFSKLSAELTIAELISECKEVEALAERRSAEAPPDSTERAFQAGIALARRTVWLRLHDGSQQPQGGDAVDARRKGETPPPGRVVAEGGSVLCDGVALAQLSAADLEKAREEVNWLLSPDGQRDLIERIVQTAAPIVEDGGTEEQLEAFAEVFVDACLTAHCLTQQSSGGQEAKGICGNAGLLGQYCELPAGHDGWHAARNPAIGTGTASWSHPPGGQEGGVEEAVALLQREAEDAAMWAERHGEAELYVGATQLGDWPWIGDLCAVHLDASRARVAQEERAATLRAAAALVAKSPASTQPISDYKSGEGNA